MTKRSKYRSKNAKSLALRRFSLGFFFALSFVSFGFFEPWNLKNDPHSQWGQDVIVNFYDLIQAVTGARDENAQPEAYLPTLPWTNTYYPKWKGGFAVRDVQLSDRQLGPFTLQYRLHPNSELVRMSDQELELLSGAEKIDIINGRTTDEMAREYEAELRRNPNYEEDLDDYYSGKRSVKPRLYPYYSYLRSIRRDVEPRVDDPHDEVSQFAGWCQPLSLASIHHPEPEYTHYRVQLNDRNASISLPLRSSDIKGFLMSAYEDRLDEIPNDDPNYLMVDRRCYDRDSPNYNAEDCKYINAGTFHVILMNQIALKKKGFVADFDAGRPIWNHAVEGFKVLDSYWYTDRNGEYLHSSKASPKSVRERVYKTKIFYVKNSIGTHKYAMGKDTIAANYYYSKTMSYRIELDEKDNILGGTWLDNGVEPMDFFWYYPKIQKFEGDYEFLNGLLK